MALLPTDIYFRYKSLYIIFYGYPTSSLYLQFNVTEIFKRHCLAVYPTL